MPAAISPTAARRCCRRASRSSFLMSVTSWNVKRYPARPPGVSQVGDAQADLDVLAGPHVVRLHAARAAAVRGRAVSASTASSGSCSTSAIGRPTTDANGWPVMFSAARLNVRIRPVLSVVARPLGRLSMTCWLSACRSAIWFDACSSRAPVVRTRFGERPAQQRDGEEAERVEHVGVLRDRSRRQHRRRPATGRACSRPPSGTASARRRRTARRSASPPAARRAGTARPTPPRSAARTATRSSW